VAVVALSALSCIGQALAYVNPDSYDDLNVGIFFVIIASGIAGMVSSLAGYPLTGRLESEIRQEGASHTRELYRGLKLCALGAAIELVLGEILALIALLTGATDDWSLLLVALAISAGGGGCLVLGWLAGLFVLWPVLTLLGMLRQRLTGKPIDEVAGLVSALSLTMIAFAITGVLGLGSAGDDVVGTPQSRGLAQVVILLLRYTGTPAEQVLSWVARILLVAFVLEIVWLVHLARLSRRSGNS
jgi:hypothetical protein